MRKLSKVRILLPALITNKEQEAATERCMKSLENQITGRCVKITLDTDKYDKAVAGVWNKFFDTWRGQEYDYLVITANDTEADPLAIEFMAKCLEDNPSAGMVTGKVCREIEEFKKGFGQQEYTQKLTAKEIDPACFMLRKNVMEKVGRIDEYFPREFVERDLIYRIKLAGWKVIQPDVVLWYHPPYSMTIGNDMTRLDMAFKRYVYKWGGDADKEVYTHPLNDFNLNFTYCIE